MAEPLGEIAGNADKRKAVIEDCLAALDLEVASKGGISGIAIKGGYKLVKSVKPGFLRDVMDHLLDDFLAALDPLYQEALEKGVPPGDHLEANRPRVANALLEVTDKRAKNAKMAVLKKTYGKLRPMAQKQVENAAPRLADLLRKHAATA